MHRDQDSEEPLTTGELTELLADATGEDPEALDRGAREFYIGPPESTEPVDE